MNTNRADLISVAPMIDWTNRHFRYLLRLISSNAVVYTEMITANALLYGRHPAACLAFHPDEHPIVLQLGGSDPLLLQQAAKMGEEAGFSAINLNVGCPSPRVTSGRFGVCLMQEPDLVAACVDAMQQVVNIPVTVKCRIGVDHQDQYEFLHQFIETVAKRGCKTFIVHARKAWLKGLSPKQNREIPPLQYETVCQLKRDFPNLTIIINGGFKAISTIKDYLQQVDGCMLGRIICENPYFLADVEAAFFEKTAPKRQEIVYAYLDYMERSMQSGVKLAVMGRFLLNLFHAVKGAAEWRRYLSTEMYKENCSLATIEKGLALVV